ncbi:P-loop containing nucleoside triphosphate hydrolase protein [Gyrodon lividus]|nr:P-loop containing nucleoside triphosphate hydrolase protein [Gyrodon lividus]
MLLQYAVPSASEMKQAVLQKFHITPCDWQIQSAHAQLERKDVITVSPTGSGKTMMFWIPMLFNTSGITISITPLNILREKTEVKGNLFGISAVNLTAKTATDEIFKEIEAFKYWIIAFTNRLFNITVDKGHCISEWGDKFWSDYGELGKLWWLLPSHVMFHVASATMPPHVLRDVQNKLHMQSNRLVKSSLKSLHNLDHALNFKGGQPQTPFMAFVNGCNKTERLTKHLQKMVPQHLQDKFVWFHSGMSMAFCSGMIEKLRKGELWGIFCTDTAGMELDLRDIHLVIQWRYTKLLCTLLQHLGRAARDPNLEAVAVYFVEGEYFDEKPGKALKKQKSASSG